MNRELFIFGTAGQVPTRWRNHNSCFLRWDDQGFLFDPGEGTQRQLMLAGLSVSTITHICVTHFHGDHCLGLPGIIQRISLDEVAHDVTVHYPASGQEYFDRLRHASIFHDVAPIVAQPIKTGGIVFETDRFTITTRALSHSVDSWGYRIEEKPARKFLPDRLQELGVVGPDAGRLQQEGEIEVNGRLVTADEVSYERPGQIFAFVMDTRPCPAAIELARDADMLVCESTFLSPEVDLADRFGHMTAAQAATLAEEAGARRLVLTHFSQRHPDTQQFLDEAHGIHLDTSAATDGIVISVPGRRDVPLQP